MSAMSSKAKLSRARGERSVLSAKDKHRMQELPKPRILACTACRGKKHLCDRKQPICTACLKVGAQCVYADRKPHATEPELLQMLQKLERKYVGLLQTTKRKARTSLSSVNFGNLNPHPLLDETDASILGSRPSVWHTSLDGLIGFFTSKYSQPPTGEPYGGYCFNEAFLIMPATLNTASSRLSEANFELHHLETSASSYPTRIFTLGTRNPPAQSPIQRQFQDSLVLYEPQSLEEDKIEIGSIASTLSPSICPTPSPWFAFDVWQPSVNDSQTAKETPQYLTSPITHRPPVQRVHIPSSPDITPEPSLQFSRATWWDYLLSTYTISPKAPHATISRHTAASEISQDVCIFFHAAPTWMYWFHIPLFFDMFHHTELRATIQPSLVLSILAYSKLLQSIRDSSCGGNVEGRERSWKQSVVLRNLAQASFEASYNGGWMDLPLAQAAWILVLYELTFHRDATLHRLQSSIMLLDATIRCLGLTTMDSMDPRAPAFASDSVPALGRPLPGSRRDLSFQALHRNGVSDSSTSQSSSASGFIAYRATTPPTPLNYWRSPLAQLTQPHPQRNENSGSTAGCPCEALSLAQSPEMLRSTPSWSFMPRWTPNASWAEIKREEARRLVWSTVIMLGTEGSVRPACGIPQLDLHVAKPENFALLYPGEEDYSSLPNVETTYSGKESNWALWGRTMMLWFACMRHSSRSRPDASLSAFSSSPSPTHEDLTASSDSDFAMRAWMETVAIEEALNAHTCGTEQSMMYQAREYIFQIRMLVSGCFRQSIPVAQTNVNFSRMDRDSAMKWIQQTYHTGTVLLTAITADDGNPGRQFMIDSPFVIFLYIGLVSRALDLWRLDKSLSLAREVAISSRRVFDWYQQIWPNAELQKWAANAFRDLDATGGTPRPQIP